MKDISEIKNYHIHLYYTESNIKYAKELGSVVHEKFGVAIGRYHERPVGPHPMWSMQITVPIEKLGEVQSFIAINRQDLIAFIHPTTGDDLLDHTSYIGWLGESVKLNTEMFEK